jgi:hypothetical protein
VSHCGVPILPAPTSGVSPCDSRYRDRHTATPSPARNPTTSTQWCSRTSCARTRPLTGPCPTTSNSFRPLPSWRAPNRTPSVTARKQATGGQAHPHPVALATEEGRPPARHRSGVRTPPRRPASPANAPAPTGRTGHGMPGHRPAQTARCRLHQRRRTLPKRRWSLLIRTRTPRSSWAFRGSRLSPAPGCSPRSAKTSGRNLAVMARRVKNQRLASVGYVWAFTGLTAAPPLNATSSTACSATSTTASPSALSMTKARPFRPLQLLR